MSWLCRFGIHDWEVVEIERGYNICFRVKNLLENNKTDRPNPISWSGDDWKEKKVCLRCGKIVDEIKKEEHRYKEEYLSKLDRQELAKLLIESPVQ